ncbi:MAG: asparagine--tRNA ligase [Nanoarchaeota archaeon]|nr:asparagine--tRNA ligase [Nanoarchaeota archaeon]
MKFMSIQEAMDKGKGKVSIRGWVYRERGSNKLKFIVVRDASNIIQCVIDSGHRDWEVAKSLSIEASVEITGTIKEDKRAPTGYEIHIENLNLVGESDTYPITKDQSPEFLLDKRHLWIRSRKLTAVMKVKHTVLQAFREFYIEKGFFEMPPPILQPNQCEGGSTLFEVKYYKQKIFLSQSWQLYAEAAIFGLEKIFCISPCFRAERSKTSRHLSEFMMAEMESAWMDFDGLTGSAEEVVAFIVQRVVEKNAAELELLGQDISKLKKIKAPFPRMTYREVLALLKEKEGLDIKFGKDLRTIEEDKIMKHFDKPLIVTHYPKEIMAFYKQEDPKKPGTCLCLDMLAPEGYGEIIGGSQRDTDIESLKKSLKAQGEDPKDYDWYMDLRRFGSVPHAGYGLGVERVVAWLCKLDNIKDAIPFPRTMLRWTP